MAGQNHLLNGLVILRLLNTPENKETISDLFGSVTSHIPSKVRPSLQWWFLRP